MPLYHSTHLPLQHGAIIQPGNWGRIVLAQGIHHPSWNRESILESIRAQFYPQKPSRLNSTFCCDSLETIRFYKNKNTPEGYIYEVEHLDENPLIHRGDFNAIEPLPRLPYNMSDIAHMYWEYQLKTSIDGFENLDCSEIVSSSAIRIIQQIQ